VSAARPDPGAAPEPETPLRPIIGWSLVGLGGALAVGGTLAGVLAQADEEAFRQSSDVVSKRDLRDRGEARALAADVMFVAAGAAVVGGAVVLLTGGDEAHRKHRGRPSPSSPAAPSASCGSEAVAPMPADRVQGKWVVLAVLSIAAGLGFGIWRLLAP
jgi:hypothetical protein